MKRITQILTALISSTALAACTMGPDYVRPQALPAAEGPFVGAGSASVSVEAPPSDWWRLYNDPVLDGLVQQALEANSDLRVAIANIDKARALLRETRSQRLPQAGIDAGASYGRNADPQRRADTPREDWQIYVGGQFAYEIDLAGRVRRSIEADRADALAAVAAADAVRVAVVAETTRAYADAASTAAQIRVAKRTVLLLDQSLALTVKRLEAGLATRLDVARVEALRNHNAAQIPLFEAHRDAALFRLAFLTGQAPANLPPRVGQRATTLTLERPIPVGDGRALLARRPDVREAERRLAAKTARIGVATAALYPSISFGGAIGSTSSSVEQIFASGPLHWLVGPLISWSFPNFGGARGRIAQAEAEAGAALAQFDGAILRALQETETALSSYRHSLTRQQSLRAATQQAQIAANISRAQLREGRVDFLVVLDAERSLAEAQATLAQSDADVSRAQIALFQALGGGWQQVEPYSDAVSSIEAAQP